MGKSPSNPIYTNHLGNFPKKVDCGGWGATQVKNVGARPTFYLSNSQSPKPVFVRGSGPLRTSFAS